MSRWSGRKVPRLIVAAAVLVAGLGAILASPAAGQHTPQVDFVRLVSCPSPAVVQANPSDAELVVCAVPANAVGAVCPSGEPAFDNGLQMAFCKTGSVACSPGYELLPTSRALCIASGHRLADPSECANIADHREIEVVTTVPRQPGAAGTEVCGAIIDRPLRIVNQFGRLQEPRCASGPVWLARDAAGAFVCYSQVTVVDSTHQNPGATASIGLATPVLREACIESDLVGEGASPDARVGDVFTSSTGSEYVIVSGEGCSFNCVDGFDANCDGKLGDYCLSEIDIGRVDGAAECVALLEASETSAVQSQGVAIDSQSVSRPDDAPVPAFTG